MSERAKERERVGEKEREGGRGRDGVCGGESTRARERESLRTLMRCAGQIIRQELIDSSAHVTDLRERERQREVERCVFSSSRQRGQWG